MLRINRLRAKVPIHSGMIWAVRISLIFAGFIVFNANAGQADDESIQASSPQKSEDDPAADVADIPSQECQAQGDAGKRYFLIGPRKEDRSPTKGVEWLEEKVEQSGER